MFVQQGLAEARNIAFNHYNEIHPFEKILEGISKAVLTTLNKKILCFFYGFMKQQAIVDIDLTPTFLEEVKHHWGSFTVLGMLQEKLYCVDINNVDAEIKVG